ncbi:MAG: aminopeptidase [Clostridia bacterium]|nr:aminopeptidase [Clostridia bacterium]
MSELSDKLLYTKESIYRTCDGDKKDKIFAYAKGYMQFLDAAKTEREAVKVGVAMAEARGYKPYVLGAPVKAGDCYYYNNRNKNLFVFRVGTAPIEEDGIRIIAAHIDSPRLDIKQCPVYEDSEMCFLKTHYYGGIKKYQWTALPLALHGVVVLKDGTQVEISVGEDESDPIFYINDLLPHLSQEQYKKSLGEAIPGESLNVLIGAMPMEGEDGDAIKMNVLRILNEKYGMTEGDFLSAEISAVPAGKARDVGFDRALICAYGHDDRVCSYPALTAIFDSQDTTHTVISILADKEEVGSEGNTGMQSILLQDIMDQISISLGANPRIVRNASYCLSADVNAAYDPNFKGVYEKANSAILSCGAALSKYTGSRGKSGSNDASAEFIGKLRRIFAEHGVVWQSAELGKVDQGGGGTVAKYIAGLNIETVDLGVPVISMHAPYEVISKADLYSTYEAFLAFID